VWPLDVPLFDRPHNAADWLSATSPITPRRGRTTLL
jgi:hypothetical protein